MRTPIYLDNNATTTCDPRVLDAMLPYFTELFGNASSSTHLFGRQAKEAVECARASIATALGAADPGEIVFTSGATESDNLAIKGVSEAYADRGDHIVTVRTEHKAVLDSCHRMEQEGFRVTYLDVAPDGLVDPDEVHQAITDDTILVSVMAANNEIGVLQDIAAIGAICREHGVLFHTDATQAIGKIPFDVVANNVDLASFTGHKVYGPKGAGGLYVRKDPGVRLQSQVDGGGHEGGFRSGTLNVTGIVGLAAAIDLACEEMPSESRRVEFLRDRLWCCLHDALGDVRLNGHSSRRLPGHLSLIFPGVPGERLLADLPEIALSTTAACTSGSPAPSYVLKALGVPDELAACTVRFGIGRYNTEEEIDYTINRVARRVRELRPQPALRLR